MFVDLFTESEVNYTSIVLNGNMFGNVELYGQTLIISSDKESCMYSNGSVIKRHYLDVVHNIKDDILENSILL
jgi:hypothetical protein